ncbi:MAG: hypothetical protein H7Y04_14995 [Verrucomicrobia bacterium]|nr:hypothetical protein [Cytophagales bacterium]
MLRILMLMVFFCQYSFGQTTEKAFKPALLLGYNYNYNNKHFAEAGLVMGHRDSGKELIAGNLVYLYGVVSSEFLIASTETIFCPKVGVHLALGFVHVGITALYYTDLKTQAIGIRPEVGLTAAGVVSICYGWNMVNNLDEFSIYRANLGVKVIFGSGLKLW